MSALSSAVKALKKSKNGNNVLNYSKILLEELNKRRATLGLGPVQKFSSEKVAQLQKYLPWLAAAAAPAVAYGGYKALFPEKSMLERIGSGASSLLSGLGSSIGDIASDVSSADLSAFTPLLMSQLNPQMGAFAGTLGQPSPMIGEMGQPLIDVGSPNIPISLARRISPEEVEPIQNRLDAYTPQDFHLYM